MKTTLLFVLAVLVGGCDLASGNKLEDHMRSDALERAASDCSAARSCRVAIKSAGEEWIVTVSPTAIGISGDPQFNSGATHVYHYDASGQFLRETPD